METSQEKDNVTYYQSLLSKQEDFTREHLNEDGKRNLTPYSELEYYIDGDLDPHQYESMLESFTPFAPGSFMPYFRVHALLQALGPPEEFMDADRTECMLRCELQALMQHTAERLIEMNWEEIEMFLDGSKVDTVDLTLFSTWSFDMAVEDDRYKSWSCGVGEISTYTVTPIRMIMNNDWDQTLWINAMPQSLRFCRPIWLIRGNTVQVTKPEIEKEVSNLKRIRVSLPNGKMVHVNFSLVLSLTEENALQYVPEASKTKTCLICGVSPDAMNKVDILDVDSKDHTVPYYSFTPLYIWVRFFEFLMEISFRFNLGQWKITDDTKEQYEQRKQAITQKIYDKFNDPENAEGRSGPICQRAFANPAELSSLLGIDKELIVRFRNIAIAVNVLEPINPYRLDSYCKDTYRHCLNLYAWCQIPTTIHQILAHGAEVYMHAPPALIYLAEEIAEPLDIELKPRLTHHAQPRNVRIGLKDVFFRAMHGSDPIISSCWIQRRRKHRYNQGYPREVLDMLLYKDESCNHETNHIVMKLLEYDVGEIDLQFRKYDE